MIEVVPSCSLIREAAELSDDMGELKNSITRGQGNIYGFLGELLVANYISAVIKRTHDYDIIKGNVRIDVKTKSCTSKPKPHYFCTVADFNTRQACDYYAFVRILEDFSCAWILGYIDKIKFYQQALFFHEGDRDPTYHNGWCFKADCYNLPISSLIQFKIRHLLTDSGEPVR